MVGKCLGQIIGQRRGGNAEIGGLNGNSVGLLKIWRRPAVSVSTLKVWMGIGNWAMRVVAVPVIIKIKPNSYW